MSLAVSMVRGAETPGILFQGFPAQGGFFFHIGQSLLVVGVTVQKEGHFIDGKADLIDPVQKLFRVICLDATGMGASFPAEGFAQFREDGSHLQPFAEVKGFRPFLEGHVSHGCGKVFIQTGKSVAAPGSWTRDGRVWQRVLDRPPGAAGRQKFLFIRQLSIF